MLKRYYKLQLEQMSPLHLSNGDSSDSDSDLLKDNKNRPFIPGPGLIGAMRDLLPNEDAKKLFGWIDGDHQQSSKVIGSDAILPQNASDEDIHLTYRDGVSLDLFRGTAIKSAKYDLEIVETRLPYVSILEWTGEAGDESCQILDRLVSQIVTEGLQLGGKVTRGYGAMKVTAWKHDFDFPKDLQDWLSFQPRDEKNDGWSPVNGSAAASRYREYQMSFRVVGPVSVRVYSSETGQADFVPLKSMNKKPVIPGTSWAGAFRHRMHEIACELSFSPKELEDLDALFGKLKNGMKRSAITFSETELQGGREYEITRNALDRFTAGPAMSALFTAGYWYGGTGTLTIRIEKDHYSKYEQLLLAALKDLDLGLMTIGGSASTGLGRLQITQLCVDGQPRELHMEVKKHE